MADRPDAYRLLSTSYYDITKPHAPADALAFYRQQAALADGPVLEPMAGSGRFLLPLLAEGIDIEGTDASPEMIDACMRHAEAAGVSPRIHRQFLHELQLDRDFALVMIPAGSFGLLIDESQIAESLRRLRQHVRAGGAFVFEVETPAAAPRELNRWGGAWVEHPTGGRIVLSSLTNSYDDITHVSRQLNRYELVDDGRLVDAEFEWFDLKLYPLEEITARLRDCGFAEVRCQRPWGSEPASDDDPVAVVVARP